LMSDLLVVNQEHTYTPSTTVTLRLREDGCVNDGMCTTNRIDISLITFAPLMYYWCRRTVRLSSNSYRRVPERKIFPLDILLQKSAAALVVEPVVVSAPEGC
jgi:hypothetical protein